MEVFFERQAMRGEPLPHNFDIVDSCAYMALKSLYAMYKAGLIEKNLAARDKKAIINNWTRDKSKIEFINKKTYDLRDRLLKTSEEYCKNPSIEAADRMYAAFFRLPDNWREKYGE